jgi:hypothetical protein
MSDAAETVDPSPVVDNLLAALEVQANRLELTEEELAEMGAFEEKSFMRLTSRENWDVLHPVLTEEYRQRACERYRAYFQDFVRHKLVEDWLERQTIEKKHGDRDQIQTAIQIYLRQDRREELREYLTNVARFGLEKANKKRKQEQRSGGYFGHIWAGSVGLARFMLAIGIFAAAESKFETIVLALLILIHIGIQGAYMADRYYTMLMAFGIDRGRFVPRGRGKLRHLPESAIPLIGPSRPHSGIPTPFIDF